LGSHHKQQSTVPTVDRYNSSLDRHHKIKARVSHSVCPQRPIHPPVKWLSNHAKCGNVPPRMQCRSS
jgi:hypothetical protein